MIVAYFLMRNIYPYLLPAIMSLLDHNKVEKIYVFCEDDVFPYELPDVCEVINVTDKPYILPSSPNWRSQYTWIGVVKTALPKFLPGLDKIITLDVDTIVADSLDPLWQLDLGDNYIAMVNERIGGYRILGREKYYNFGVALWNLRKIREDGVDNKLIWIMNNRRMQFIGQEAWNLYYYDKIVEIDTRFNESQVTGRTDHPAVVHYAGTGRWWMPHLDRHEFYDEYRRFEKF